MNNNVASNTKISSMDTTRKEASFAQGFNFYKFFWIFYLGCLFGVIVETIWCRVTNGFFESRTALILEPLNPVYGFGAVIISLLFIKFEKKSNLFIFLGCMITGGVFEWICSFFQECVFGTISWKYYKDTLGIFGRTSLIYCIFWGVLGVLWVRFIYPFISAKIESIPNKIGKNLTVILAVIVSIDIIFTSCALLRQQERRENIPANNIIRVFFDTNYNDERLKIIYPHMTPVKK